MSHIIKAYTKYTDKRILSKACDSLGLKFDTDPFVVHYMGSKILFSGQHIKYDSMVESVVKSIKNEYAFFELSYNLERNGYTLTRKDVGGKIIVNIKEATFSIDNDIDVHVSASDEKRCSLVARSLAKLLNVKSSRKKNARESITN